MLFAPTSGPEANFVKTADLRTWHQRLGHVNVKTLRNFIQIGQIRGAKLRDVDNFSCEHCHIEKSHRRSFEKSDNKRVCEPGEMIHSDVCGPMQTESLGGARYFLLFKDEATGFRYVYFIKNKSDVFDCFKVFESMLRNQIGHAIKILRVDRGREYLNSNMNSYLASRGIMLETTAPYTPQQNKKAERDNRTIVESARTMLGASGLPNFLWAEAVHTAVYTLNGVQVNAATSVSPYEAWTSRRP